MNKQSLRKLSVVEMQRLDIDTYKQSDKIPLVVLLDNVRSMHNVGAIFRTADAFRLEKILLCGITAAPPHPLIHKTALGAEDSVDWEYFEYSHKALDDWKNKGYTIACLEQTTNSIMLGNTKPAIDKGIVLIVGNEVHGVDDSLVEKCDFCIEIPQYGTKHSLNVSVATGIALFELQKILRS